MSLHRLLIVAAAWAAVALGMPCNNGATKGDTCAIDVEETGIDSGKLHLLQRDMKLAETSQHALPSFTSFIQQYGRAYSTDTKEYQLRQNIYDKRLTEVHRQNSQPDRTWDATVNHLSDRTEDELSRLRGLRLIQSSSKGPGVVSAHRSLRQGRSDVVPEEKSWAHLDAVQQEVDQGGCGSCWAFATSMMLQANAEIHGLNRTFSPQELVDCVQNPHRCGGEGGCEGATIELAMNWVISQGLDTESSTPYTGYSGSCKKMDTTILMAKHDDESLEDMIAVGFHPAITNGSHTSTNPLSEFSNLKGWYRLEENKYGPLITAVATRGPVAVSVAANEWSSYGNGLLSCQDFTINHAVVVIGYGFDTTNDSGYWIIKNSWGNGWGEGGNIRLIRQETADENNNHCGTDTSPKDGTACDDGNLPSSVQVCGTCGILYDSVVPHFDQMR